MDDSWLIPLYLLALINMALVIRGLATGRLGFGANAWDRRTQPIEFWFHVGIGAIAVPLSIMVFFRSVQADETWPAAAIIFIPMSLFWLIRPLQTGVASVGTVKFDRREEPREYWLVVLCLAACLAVWVWLVAVAFL